MNPFLSECAAKKLQAASRLWLQLCVLEDRLGRIMKLTRMEATGNAASLMLARVRCLCSTSSFTLHTGREVSATITIPGCYGL